MNNPRRFSRSQRAQLYIASDGKCEVCGEPLERGWHADHIEPYSKGGVTDLMNGRALCAECNLKKGATVSYSTLRPFQSRFVEAVLRIAQDRGRVMIANVTPGSGKTLAALVSADRLIHDGYIDHVVHLSPRINLAQQFEKDSAKCVNSPLRTAINPIYHRGNDVPLIVPNSSGYATTYSSLMQQIGLHIHAARNRRMLLICDELQQLGADYDGGDSTRSAEAVKQLAQYATLVIGMTGTPRRSDGNKLLFCEDKYSDPDEEGYQYLNADAEATYRQGVTEGYLRKFEAHLYDGGIEWRNILGEAERLNVSEMEDRLYRVLREPQYWNGLVDHLVEHANEQRRIVHTGLRDLVAAYDQTHAREIVEYLRKRHNINALLAISEDGEKAHDALRDFKTGKYTTLVTVNMAYVGYDYQPISHILPLTAYRFDGYLNQLFARGLRVWSEIEPDKQTCVVVAPRDPLMVKFTDMLRTESQLGVKQREQRKDISLPPVGPVNRELGYVDNAWFGELQAKGYHPEGDLNANEYGTWETARRQFNVPVPATTLAAIARLVNGNNQPAPAPVSQPSFSADTGLTLMEREKEFRSQLDKMVGSLASMLCGRDSDGAAIGRMKMQIWNRLSSMDGKAQNNCTLSDIEKRHKTVSYWMREGRLV